MTRTSTLRRILGTGLGCAVLGASLVTMAAPAGAAEGSSDGAAGARHRMHLTDEQKQCLEEQGITRPVRPLTAEKIQALKDAAKACDIDLPKRPGKRLTDEQKQCLEEQGITRPVRPLTAEKIQALKDAAKACDIKLPRHGRHPGGQLTDEQKQCLADQGITRPIRPLTPEKIQQLKDAAAACGIERPNANTGATS